MENSPYIKDGFMVHANFHIMPFNSEACIFTSYPLRDLSTHVSAMNAEIMETGSHE